MYKHAVILLCLCLTACSSLDKKVWFESTDSLIDKHQYQHAIEQVQNTKPIDTALLKNIQRRANIYRRDQLKQLQILLIQKQWKKADLLLLKLKSTQPAHKQFERAEKKLDQLRNEERLILASEVALAQARLLIKKTDQLLFERLNTQSKLYWWQSNTPLQNEKHTLAETLLNLSTEAVAQNNFMLAQKTYEHALTLNPRDTSKTLQATINKGLAIKNAATIKQRQTALILKLNEAVIEENFEQIIKLLSALPKPPFKDKDIQLAITQAQDLLFTNAQELDQLADSIYRQGDISRAMALWQQAQVLAPSLPELKDKLTRAQKIKDKLDHLRQSQKQ